MEAFEKENLNTLTTVTTVAGPGEYYIDLPMLCTRVSCQGYDNGEKFPVTVGENGHVRAILPAGYQGTVKVWYSGMWYWRVAEGVSLLFWVAVTAYEIISHKKQRERE